MLRNESVLSGRTLVPFQTYLTTLGHFFQIFDPGVEYIEGPRHIHLFF